MATHVFRLTFPHKPSPIFRNLISQRRASKKAIHPPKGSFGPEKGKFWISNRLLWPAKVEYNIPAEKYAGHVTSRRRASKHQPRFFGRHRYSHRAPPVRRRENGNGIEPTPAGKGEEPQYFFFIDNWPAAANNTALTAIEKVRASRIIASEAKDLFRAAASPLV